MCIGAAAACVREVDFDMFQSIGWLQSLHQQRLHWVILAVAVSPLLLYAIKNHQDIPASIMLGFRKESWPFLLASGFIAGALFADHAGFEDRSHIFEELLETYGYAFLLLAALRHAWLAEVDPALA